MEMCFRALIRLKMTTTRNVIHVVVKVLNILYTTGAFYFLLPWESFAVLHLVTMRQPKDTPIGGQNI